MRTDFEEFALNHDKHEHCIGCGGCLLDPRVESLKGILHPFWCVSCRDKIDANMPKGMDRPWEIKGYGVRFD